MEKKLFTSESVSMGHPDKVADQISDAFLDECLRGDSNSRVACETLVTTGLVVVAGEVRTSTYVDTQKLVREVVREIGYTEAGVGFDADSCAVLSAIHEQSDDIAMGVDDDAGSGKTTGAGDQGMMFGYACDETDALMPAPIHWSHKLVERQAQLRREGALPWLRPDAKSQVTLEYVGGRPHRVDAVVLSTQTAEVDIDLIRREVEEQIIRAVLPSAMIDADTRFHINPTGKFVIGGPHGDAGLTGRKIIVDTYGGYARHGGGAFSGKDPTKVDRSAAYAARWVAKNVVKAGWARHCELQLSYAIGVAEPVSLRIDTFGTAAEGWSDADIAERLRGLSSWNGHAAFTPDWIIGRLGLREPRGWSYRQTASHGHFGRDLFPWEKLDLVEELQSLAVAGRSA